MLLKLLKSGTAADTKAAEIRGVVKMGRQVVYSRAGSEFKVAVGVFWN